jgi:hypothetical protein
MKYIINGKPVIVDKALTDAEIDEIAADLGGSRPTSGPQAIPTGGNVPAPVAQPQMSAGERMFNNALMGAAAVPILGAGARGIQALTQATKAAPYTANLAKAFLPQSGRALAAEGTIGAASGLVGGETGQQVAQKFGEPYRAAGEFAGGLGSGLFANTVTRNVPEMALGAFRSQTGNIVDDVANAAGGVRARGRLAQAMEANPTLSDDLLRAKEIEASTGVKLPVTAASKGDTTLGGLVTSQTSRGENASFTAFMANQEKEALEAVKQAQRRLAGDPKNAEALAAVEAKKVELENFRRETAAEMRLANQNRTLETIDTRIKTLTEDNLNVATDKEDIGNRISSLLSAKEKAVRADFSKNVYEPLLNKAKTDGVEMESQVAAVLWNYIKQEKAGDVFAKFPGLTTQVERAFAPKKTPTSSKFAEKYPNLVRSAEGTFQNVSVTDVDSLKRAVNKAIGDTQDRDQSRILLGFKKQLDEAIGTMPESFSVPYKQADKDFAAKVGMPFSEAGVVSVDRSRFVESVVPMLTNKPSAVRQVLAASDNSPEAIKIIEDAFLMRISQTDGIVNKNTLEVNPAALTSFIKKNSAAIDQVPGLKERLQSLSNNVEALRTNRTRILDEQKQATIEKFSNVWSESYGSKGGFEGFVNNALKTPEDMNRLIRMAGSDSSLRNGLKSTILEIGLNSPNKVAFYTDNAKALDSLFGKEHSQTVKDLLEGAERLAQFPLRNKVNQTLTQQTGFEREFGTDPAKAASLIRQQVQSTFYKASTLFSRFVQNKATKSEAAEIQEFLKNPGAVADAAELLKALNDTSEQGIKKALSIAGKLAKNTASAGIFGGLAPVITGELGLSERQPVQQYAE